MQMTKNAGGSEVDIIVSRRPKWMKQAKHIALLLFSGILLLPAFSDGKMRRVFHVLFFLLCFLYTADWKLCVFHCFFFHGYFVRTVWLYIALTCSLSLSLSFSIPLFVLALSVPPLFGSLFKKLLLSIASRSLSFLLNCWLTFSAHFHINYFLRFGLQRNESSPSKKNGQIRCMTFPFTIVRLIAFERCISLCTYFFSYDFAVFFLRPVLKIISPSECGVVEWSVVVSFVSLYVVVLRFGDLFSRFSLRGVEWKFQNVRHENLILKAKLNRKSFPKNL
jgi:hypothetical protein